MAHLAYDGPGPRLPTEAPVLLHLASALALAASALALALAASALASFLASPVMRYTDCLRRTGSLSNGLLEGSIPLRAAPTKPCSFYEARVDRMGHTVAPGAQDNEAWGIGPRGQSGHVHFHFQHTTDHSS